MRYDINWNAVKEVQDGDYLNPVPGAYIAVIHGVEDKEDKEYLEIQWDFAEGEYAGNNQETYARAGFWPTLLRRSYKKKAEGFFKAFYTNVERSNMGYVFDPRNLNGLVGKYFGVVLGEEEYRKKNGEISTRLYVAQVKSISAIHDGDFKVPELKRLTGKPSDYSATTPPTRLQQNYGYQPTFEGTGFQEIDDANGTLPF